MEAGTKDDHPAEDDMKKKATPEQLVDWRMGHHIEAAGKMIADALNRIADQMAADHQLQAAEVDLRREHLLSVLESKAMADRAAQKLMGLMPDGPGFVRLHDLREPKGRDLHDLGDEPRPGPDWIKDVLTEDADAHKGKPS